MNNNELQHEARGLNNLLDRDTVAETTWSPSDLKSMLEHQLSVELATDLGPVVPDAEATLSVETTASANPPGTFGDVLANDRPPVSLLRLIKDFAKDLRYADDNAVPDDLLMVLYHAALVAAEVRAGASITSLAEKDLIEGCRWALEKDWLTPELRELFEEGKRKMREE